MTLSSRSRAWLAITAAALAAAGCSRLFGIKVRAEASAPVAASCIDAALAGDRAQRTEHRAGWTGWELDGPSGRVRVDLLEDDVVQVEWARLNRPWPAADCARMRPFVDGIYERLRGGCPSLPSSARDLDLPCSD